MNKKHTPAPWEVNLRATRNVKHRDITIANCSSSQDGSREEEEIANAKLIAAAHELLEACKIALHTLDCIDFTREQGTASNRLYNAIKKATK